MCQECLKYWFGGWIISGNCRLRVLASEYPSEWNSLKLLVAILLSILCHSLRLVVTTIE